MKTCADSFCRAAVAVLAASFLLWPGRAPAQARPAGPDEAAQVQAAIETLADHPAGLVQLFAKRLADALANHKVALTPKLAALPLRPNAVSPDEKDIARVRETVARIISVAKADKPFSLALRAELLGVIAKHCPSSAGAMDAADALARLAEAGLLAPPGPAGGAESAPPRPEEAAAAIREALFLCFDHTYAAWITTDDVAALRQAASENLMGQFAYLQACAGQKPDAAALAKALAGVRARVAEGAGPREADNAPGADDLLKALLAQLDVLGQSAQALAELAGERKDIARLLQQFLSAVSREDRALAAASATPAMAKALEKLPSLRSAIGGAEVEKIEFQGIAAFGATGEKRSADARVLVTVKGAAKARTARLALEKTADGWKIAVP